MSDNENDNQILRELENARRDLAQVRAQEEQNRLDISAKKTGHLAALENATDQLREDLRAQHTSRDRQIDDLKRKLDECAASGDNEGMMVVLDEIAHLEKDT